MRQAEVNVHIITLSAVMLLKLFEQNKKNTEDRNNLCCIVQIYALLIFFSKSVSCWLKCICIIVA